MDKLIKYFIAGVIPSLLITSASYAFDMDAALVIYQEEKNNQYQEVQQGQAPQQHTREYYQQKWLEQQGQAAQPVAHQQQEQYAQATPEADDLFMAAVNGNNAQIGKLLAQGLDVNVSNSERETALHMAAARGHYSTVIYLINNGAYPTARTVKNWIPLHHAVRFRHHNIANFLVKRGSPVGERTSDGLSVVDMARNVNDHRLLAILGAQ
jgi:hypothetical protein